MWGGGGGQARSGRIKYSCGWGRSEKSISTKGGFIFLQRKEVVMPRSVTGQVGVEVALCCELLCTQDQAVACWC